MEQPSPEPGRDSASTAADAVVPEPAAAEPSVLLQHEDAAMADAAAQETETTAPDNSCGGCGNKTLTKLELQAALARVWKHVPYVACLIMMYCVGGTYNTRHGV